MRRGVLDFIYPSRCVFCRAYLPGGGPGVCKKCGARLSGLEDSFASKDGRTLYYALPYSDVVRSAILRFKFCSKPQYARTLAGFMVPIVRKIPEVDYVTWAPAAPLRRFRRGYDQSRLLAKYVARGCGLPCVRLLYKVRNTRPQSKIKNHNLRFENIHGAYRASEKYILGGRHVVLIDDVSTTGATMCECADILRKAGAVKIDCVALAHK